MTLGLVFAMLGSFRACPQAMANSIALPSGAKITALSTAYTPAHLQGVVIDPTNPFKFDFLIHQGDARLNDKEKTQEYATLVKYFLASLTIADQDQWVNLSPYEKNRIIDDNFGKTEMGRDLLAQDYILKQVTSSLMYPESGLGKKLWDEVHKKAQEKFGDVNIPVNVFNRVWIVPDEAVVYESGNTAYIIKSHLKVMLEEDYLARQQNMSSPKAVQQHTSSPNVSVGDLVRRNGLDARQKPSGMTSQIIREIILPELEREVNQGQNFAQLRQIVSGMVLATWYKKALKDSLLAKIYADKAKIKGVGYSSFKNGSPIQTLGDDINVIYQNYLTTLKKGAFNYIKETELPSGQSVTMKYFAGGFVNSLDEAMQVTDNLNLFKNHPAVLELHGEAPSVDVATILLHGSGGGLERFASPAMNSSRNQVLVLSEALLLPWVSLGEKISVTYELKGSDEIVTVMGEVVGISRAQGKVVSFQVEDKEYRHTILVNKIRFKDRAMRAVSSANLKRAAEAGRKSDEFIRWIKQRYPSGRITQSRESLFNEYVLQGGVINRVKAFEVMRNLGLAAQEPNKKEEDRQAFKVWYEPNYRQHINTSVPALLKKFKEASPENTSMTISKEDVSNIVRDHRERLNRVNDQRLKQEIVAWFNRKYPKGVNKNTPVIILEFKKEQGERLIIPIFLAASALTKAGVNYGRAYSLEEENPVEAETDLENKFKDILSNLRGKRIEDNDVERWFQYHLTRPANQPRLTRKEIPELIKLMETKYNVHFDERFIARLSPARAAMVGRDDLGGIDLNSVHLNLQVKRDSNGISLSWDKQDSAQLSHIDGLSPVILDIRPAGDLINKILLSK